MRSQLRRCGSGSVPACLACGLLVMIGWAAPARAGFSNGVEHFNGTTLDAATWQTRTEGAPVNFTQNDALTIDTSAAPGLYGDYVTRTRTVPVGGSVRADVVIDEVRRQDTPGAQLVRLGVTDKSAGTGRPTFEDTAGLTLFVSFAHDPSGDSAFGSAQLGRTGAGGGIIVMGEQQLGVTYVYQLERLTLTKARFSIFERDAGGGPALLGTQTEEYGNFPDASEFLSESLFVSIGTHGVRATFDNVTLNRPLPVSAVPLPPALWTGLSVLALAGGWAAAKRAKWGLG